jgi:hypothetical protein
MRGVKGDPVAFPAFDEGLLSFGERYERLTDWIEYR